jgi:hypothetical protein
MVGEQMTAKDRLEPYICEVHTRISGTLPESHCGLGGARERNSNPSGSFQILSKTSSSISLTMLAPLEYDLHPIPLADWVGDDDKSRHETRFDIDSAKVAN